MPRADEPEERGWAEFDAALRGLPTPEPAPGLRVRCLPQEARHRWRVLAVDDEPAIRRLIDVHLTRAGYEVVSARDGNEGLAAVAEQRPDLILLDLVMPGMNGFQVLEILKSDPATGEIPVVMLTAKSDLDHMRRGWQVGADCYMTKPFDPEELRAVVDRMTAVIGTPENPPPLRRWAK